MTGSNSSSRQRRLPSTSQLTSRIVPRYALNPDPSTEWMNGAQISTERLVIGLQHAAPRSRSVAVWPHRSLPQLPTLYGVRLQRSTSLHQEVDPRASGGRARRQFRSCGQRLPVGGDAGCCRLVTLSVRTTSLAMNQSNNF